MPKYYAVRNGRYPGVYDNYLEYQAQVHKFPGYIAKGFDDFYDAVDFAFPYGDGPDVDDVTDWHAVFTDGCCENNGTRFARAGYGICWANKGSGVDLAEPLDHGRQTNNRAEIHSVIQAVLMAKDNGIEYLRVYTDSNFLVQAMTKWMPNWKSNGWRLCKGGRVRNKQDFQELDSAMEDIYVDLRHIPAHIGIAGNEQADQLAEEGAAM